jgi:EAL domain-containing protein (putative c-di-GMP-specific phosphodiesterase class I)/GGDEF domain-containing protein
MERELRFKLALRMGLPIFFLTVLLAFVGLSEYFEKIPPSFYMTAIVILGVMIYFIFFLIYAGFDERITDPISKTFTREYLLNYLQKEINKDPYTLLLVSVENLDDINERFGTKNGDRVLQEFSSWVGNFLNEKGIEKFPIGHFKGGDFLIGLKGTKAQHLSILELLCLKADSYMIDDIELHVTGAVVDTSLSVEIDQLIVELFEQQKQRKFDKHDDDDEEIDPSELEAAVIDAIKQKKFSMMFQEVKEGEKRVILDASVKLVGREGKLIHQKKYMPVINRLGLSRAYDLMLLEHVVELYQKHDCGTIIALSLFPSTVRNHNFFEMVQVLFTENSAAKGRVMFMLEEREYYNQIHRFNDIVQSYRRMGILVALDHLGGYHTTMLYLKNLDVDVVRYDMHLGKYIKERNSQAILRGLDLSAHCLDVKTWVKMIEDQEGAKTAQDIGINFIQGNYIGTIAPLEDFLEKK